MKTFLQSTLILLFLISSTFMECKTNSAFSCPEDKPITCSDNSCVSTSTECSASGTSTTTNPRDQINQALKDLDNARKTLSKSSRAGRSIARKVLINLNKIKLALKNENCEEKITDAVNALIDISDQVDEKTCDNSSRKAIILDLASPNCIPEEDANAFLDIANDSTDTVLSVLETDSDNDSIPDACGKSKNNNNNSCPEGKIQCSDGSCRADGECASGKECPNNCTNSTHGTCKSNGQCVCNPGFLGKDCSETDSTANQTCPNNCSFSGDCKSGICSCHAGFSGIDCSVKDGTTSQECPNNCTNSTHGTCKSGQCVCNAGFSGIDCSATDSTSNQACPNNCTNSTHGTCKSNGQCVCNAGFTGTDCSKQTGI